MGFACSWSITTKGFKNRARGLKGDVPFSNYSSVLYSCPFYSHNSLSTWLHKELWVQAINYGEKVRFRFLKNGEMDLLCSPIYLRDIVEAICIWACCRAKVQWKKYEFYYCVFLNKKYLELICNQEGNLRYLKKNITCYQRWTILYLVNLRQRWPNHWMEYDIERFGKIVNFHLCRKKCTYIWLKQGLKAHKTICESKTRAS